MGALLTIHYYRSVRALALDQIGSGGFLAPDRLDAKILREQRGLSWSLIVPVTRALSGFIEMNHEDASDRRQWNDLEALVLVLQDLDTSKGKRP